MHRNSGANHHWKSSSEDDQTYAVYWFDGCFNFFDLALLSTKPRDGRLCQFASALMNLKRWNIELVNNSEINKVIIFKYIYYLTKMVLKLGNFLAGLFSKVVLNVPPGPFNTICLSTLSSYFLQWCTLSWTGTSDVQWNGGTTTRSGQNRHLKHHC